MVEPFKLYDTDLNDDHISWSSNYNAIEVKPDDIPQLMTLVFHDNIADKAFNNSDTHVAPGVPSNHIGNMKIEHDYRTAVKALYQGHSVQIFNWDINIDRVHEVFQDSERERFVITMPDGMPGIIASEVYELLKSHNIGLRYHL
tara:strand:+ start:529 stop:960 length:432 start_codon:yes stop_codon:yes gene_type:complete